MSNAFVLAQKEDGRSLNAFSDLSSMSLVESKTRTNRLPETPLVKTVS